MISFLIDFFDILYGNIKLYMDYLSQEAERNLEYVTTTIGHRHDMAIKVIDDSGNIDLRKEIEKSYKNLLVACDDVVKIAFKADMARSAYRAGDLRNQYNAAIKIYEDSLHTYMRNFASYF